MKLLETALRVGLRHIHQRYNHLWHWNTSYTLHDLNFWNVTNDHLHWDIRDVHGFRDLRHMKRSCSTGTTSSICSTMLRRTCSCGPDTSERGAGRNPAVSSSSNILKSIASLATMVLGVQFVASSPSSVAVGRRSVHGLPPTPGTSAGTVLRSAGRFLRETCARSAARASATSGASALAAFWRLRSRVQHPSCCQLPRFNNDFAKQKQPCVKQFCLLCLLCLLCWLCWLCWLDWLGCVGLCCAVLCCVFACVCCFDT